MFGKLWCLTSLRALKPLPRVIAAKSVQIQQNQQAFKNHHRYCFVVMQMFCLALCCFLSSNYHSYQQALTTEIHESIVRTKQYDGLSPTVLAANQLVLEAKVQKKKKLSQAFIRQVLTQHLTAFMDVEALLSKSEAPTKEAAMQTLFNSVHAHLCQLQERLTSRDKVGLLPSYATLTKKDLAILSELRRAMEPSLSIPPPSPPAAASGVENPRPWQAIAGATEAGATEAPDACPEFDFASTMASPINLLLIIDVPVAGPASLSEAAPSPSPTPDPTAGPMQAAFDVARGPGLAPQRA
jgi:hypothetical protein